MASISFVGSGRGVTTATLPPHAAGDLIFAFAYRHSSSTATPAPSGLGWMPLQALGAFSNSASIYYKIATSSSEEVGTFASATNLLLLVYRASAGATLSVGASAQAGADGNNTPVVCPALDLQNKDGTSWVVGFSGFRNAVSGGRDNPPSGMINRVKSEDSETRPTSGFDTDAGVSDWPLKSVPVSGFIGPWRSVTAEIVVTHGGEVETSTFSSFGSSASSVISTAIKAASVAIAGAAIVAASSSYLEIKTASLAAAGASSYSVAGRSVSSGKTSTSGSSASAFNARAVFVSNGQSNAYSAFTPRSGAVAKSGFNSSGVSSASFIPVQAGCTFTSSGSSSVATIPAPIASGALSAASISAVTAYGQAVGAARFVTSGFSSAEFSASVSGGSEFSAIGHYTASFSGNSVSSGAATCRGTSYASFIAVRDFIPPTPANRTVDVASTCRVTGAEEVRRFIVIDDYGRIISVKTSIRVAR